MLPHGKNMVLIDEVLSWDDESIVCQSRSHRSSDNPLMENGKLPVAALIEYGAQAMAVHEVIVLRENKINGSITSLSGVVGALKNVSFSSGELGDIDEALIIKAIRMLASPKGAIYQFEISADGFVLASGRITVNH